MGYSYRNNGQIKDFWPDDTKDEFYIAGSANMEDILDQAKHHFGEDICLNNIDIHPEYIHTSCLTYDLHDPQDWTYFLRISRK